MDSNVSNKLAWLLRSLSRSLFTPTPATTTRASFRSFTKWGTDRIARRGVMVLRPAAATCRSKHSSPPGLVICTRCTLGAAPFRVSGLCSMSNPISRSDDDGDVSNSGAEEPAASVSSRRGKLHTRGWWERYAARHGNTGGVMGETSWRTFALQGAASACVVVWLTALAVSAVLKRADGRGEEEERRSLL